MATNTWRTLPNGLVQVNGTTPQLSPSRLLQLRLVNRRYRALLLQASRATHVPLSWLLAFVTIESGGDPSAVSPAGAVGLFQLMPSWWHGHTKAEMMDPARSTQYGSELLAIIAKTQAAAYPERGLGLPGAASAYNAGSGDAKNTPHPASNAWGMREQSGYIDAIVAANNSAILDSEVGKGTSPGAPSAGGAAAIAAVGVVALVAIVALLRAD